MTDQVAEKTAFLPYAPGADGVRPLAEILEDLGRPIHPKFLQEKVKKGTPITFISWYTATRILDKYAPGWAYTTHSTLSADGQHVVVDAAIGIPTADFGVVWRSGTGSDEDDPKGYGDASDRAESQALRRAAAKFRLALHLYYEKGANGPTQHPTPAPAAPSPPATPAPIIDPAADLLHAAGQAAAPADPEWDRLHGPPITPAQHSKIQALARTARWSGTKVVAVLRKEYHQERLGALTAGQAQALIGILEAAQAPLRVVS